MKLKEGLEKEYAAYVEVNSKDSYSKGVVDFGERWANLMESHMASGETLEKCAKETSHKANTEGITGYMYGAAVHALSLVSGSMEKHSPSGTTCSIWMPKKQRQRRRREAL